MLALLKDEHQARLAIVTETLRLFKVARRGGELPCPLPPAWDEPDEVEGWDRWFLLSTGLRHGSCFGPRRSSAASGEGARPRVEPRQHCHRVTPWQRSVFEGRGSKRSPQASFRGLFTFASPE